MQIFGKQQLYTEATLGFCLNPIMYDDTKPNQSTCFQNTFEKEQLVRIYSLLLLYPVGDNNVLIALSIASNHLINSSLVF